MGHSSLSPLAFLCTLFVFVSRTSAQWQVTSLVSHEMLNSGNPPSNTSLTFTVERGSSQTTCSQNWVQYPVAAVPTSWQSVRTRCSYSALISLMMRAILRWKLWMSTLFRRELGSCGFSSKQTKKYLCSTANLGIESRIALKSLD